MKTKYLKLGSSKVNNDPKPNPKPEEESETIPGGPTSPWGFM
jgi:hypothetical protein